jgi:uncharacterized protein DUF6702
MVMRLLVAVLIAGQGPAKVPAAHPLHTSLAEIEYHADRGVLEVSVRLFADDLCAAIGGSCEGAAGVPRDSMLSSYARGSFALQDGRGVPLRLRWLGAERTGGMIILQLESDVPRGDYRGVRVLHAMLWERFSDEVNLVQVRHDRRTDTLLFTRGDPPKLLGLR